MRNHLIADSNGTIAIRTLKGPRQPKHEILDFPYTASSQGASPRKSEI